MKNLFLSTGVATLFLILSGCGKSSDVNSAAMNEPLNGKISGREWKITFGTVRRKIFNGYTVTLFDIAPGQDPCTAKYNVGEPVHVVSFSLKEISVSEYDVKAGSGNPVSLTKILNQGGDISATTQGAFGEARLTKSDAQAIEGQLDVRGNDGNYVRGKFTAKMCP